MLVVGYVTADARSCDPERLSGSLITGRIPEAWIAEHKYVSFRRTGQPPPKHQKHLNNFPAQYLSRVENALKIFSAYWPLNLESNLGRCPKFVRILINNSGQGRFLLEKDAWTGEIFKIATLKHWPGVGVSTSCFESKLSFWIAFAVFFDAWHAICFCTETKWQQNLHWR